MAKLIFKSKNLFFLFVLLSLVVFRSPAIAMSGDSHIEDFIDVIEGVEGGDLEKLYREITSRFIDERVSKEFLNGFTCGNHRWFGHWGFESSIPFNLEPLASCLNKYSPEEQKIIKGEIIKLWKDRVINITKLAQDITGLPERQAKALVGLIYNTHLLGDWIPGNKILIPLADVKAIERDIIKNLNRLFGNNSDFVKAIVEDISKISEKDPQKYAAAIIRILKKHNIGQLLFRVYGNQLLKNGITYIESNLRAIRSFFLNSETKATSVSTFDDYKKTASSKTNGIKLKVRPGILLNNGRLLVSLSEGTMAGLLCFGVESGEASYSYLQGDIFKPEFERKIQDAAVKGSTVCSGIAVAVFLGANPAGLVVLGVASGSYIVTEKSLEVWHEYQDSKYLNREDLKHLGIEIDSVLEIKIDPNISLEIDKW